MPDACQDACGGLTCADYAHETCELARLVGCLCAGCDCGRLLLGNATRAASPAPPPLPESADGGGGGGLALWSAAAASVVAVAGGAAVAGLRATKADDRAAVASLCAVAVVVVVIVGQGLIAFDVEFDYAVAADTVFDGYDFWGGVEELWRRDAWLLAAVAGASSGIWPFAKNMLTVATCIGTCAAAFRSHRGAVVGLMKSLYGLASSLIVLFAAYWASGASFVGILAVVALALPLLGARALAAAPLGGTRADGDEGDRLDRAALRVVALALAVLGLAILRVERPWSSAAANAAVAVAVVAGLGWQTRVAADGRAAGDGPEDAPLVSKGSVAPAAGVASDAGKIDSRPRDTVGRVDFWLFLLAILPVAGAGLMVINNLGQIVSARGGGTAAADVAVSLVSVANCLARLAAGRAADALVRAGRPRPAILAAANLGAAASMVVLYATGASLPGAFAGAAAAGAAYGCMWTAIPSVASDLYGLAHVGANYSLCVPTIVVASLLFSTWLAPAVYDGHADDDGDCVGADCFATAFLVTAGATLAGAGAAVGLCARTLALYELKGR